MLRSSRHLHRALPTRVAVITVCILLAGSGCGRSLATSPTASQPEVTGSLLEATLLPGDPVADQVVVALADGVDAAELAARVGAVVVRDASAEHTVALAPGPGLTALDLQQKLSADLGVRSAEPDGWLETAESRQQSFAFDDGAGSQGAFAEQPAFAAIHVERAHAVALGTGVTVAILDTGIDPRHPQLRRAYAGGVDLVDGDDDPTDVTNGQDDDGDGLVDEAFGHGTHVAGIVHGVAPEAQLLAVRVLDADGRGRLSDVVAGVRWAVGHGAKVLNLSLGTLARSETLQQALLDAERSGVVVIASAGNWGDDKPVEFPASSPQVAAIGAVDGESRPASFTSYGDIVALAAPGVAVRSAYPGGGYRLWSGTSMAAPFVAGTCALLAEIHPSWTLVQMLERIGDTAGRVRDKNGSELGAGALDAGAALAPDRREVQQETPEGEEIRPR